MTKLAADLEQAAEITTLSAVLLRRMIKQGTLKVVRVGRRILIPYSELERICKPGVKISTAK